MCDSTTLWYSLHSITPLNDVHVHHNQQSFFCLLLPVIKQRYKMNDSVDGHFALCIQWYRSRKGSTSSRRDIHTLFSALKYIHFSVQVEANLIGNASSIITYYLSSFPFAGFRCHWNTVLRRASLKPFLTTASTFCYVKMFSYRP